MDHVNPTDTHSTDNPMIDHSHDHTDESGHLTRRDFFGLSWRVLTAFAAGQTACIGLRFLSSREAESQVGKIVTAGLVSDFPVGTITPFEQARFFLIRFEDGAFLALNSKCPHLACIVGWNADLRRFSCPCHGSEFERDGRVINPPAPRPLDRFEVSFDGTRVVVDTAKPIRRTQVSTDELAYPPELPEPTPEDSKRQSPGFRQPDR